jgi:hypothetical protein
LAEAPPGKLRLAWQYDSSIGRVVHTSRKLHIRKQAKDSAILGRASELRRAVCNSFEKRVTSCMQSKCGTHPSKCVRYQSRTETVHRIDTNPLSAISRKRCFHRIGIHSLSVAGSSCHKFSDACVWENQVCSPLVVNESTRSRYSS